MKNIIYLTIGVLTLLSFTRCSDEFLERMPSDEVSSASFFTQEKDLVYAVNAVYDNAAYSGWGGGGTNMLKMEVLTDNAIDAHSWNECYQLAVGSATAYDGYVQARWQARYTGIQQVNRILEGADGIKQINSTLKARLLGESKFFRAYFYWDLVYLFGDVPFLTNSIAPNEAVGRTRDNGDMILTEMVKDLDDAAADLPLSYSNADIGRITKGAALSLKARILLYQQKWQEAAAAAKAVMDLGVYQLNPSYKKLFDYEGINCSEVIYDFQAMQGANQGEIMLIYYGSQSIGGWSCSCPLQSLVDDYECTDGKTIDKSSLYNPNKPYENRDPRLGYTILYPGHDWQGGVYNTIPGATYPGKNIIIGDDQEDGTGSGWNKSATGYNWLKYISQTDVAKSNFWDGSLHFIAIRYAEVLLSYAEAKIEANSIDQSVYDAINLVRQREDVNMPPITTGKSQTELREIVRRERRVELAFEALRLFDIRRWKIAENVMPGVPEGLTYTDPKTGTQKMITTTTRQFNASKDYLWPIPQAEIDISHLEQNPNW